MIEGHAIPSHVLFKNKFGFFLSDDPHLRNHGRQKNKWRLPVGCLSIECHSKLKKKIFCTL